MTTKIVGIKQDKGDYYRIIAVINDVTFESVTVRTVENIANIFDMTVEEVEAMKPKLPVDQRPFIPVENLQEGYHMFGNKGTVWSDSAHIAKNGSPTTLCGTPMLSTNHARLNNMPHVRCEECLKVYANETQKIDLNESWLNGKYANGEINTLLPYVSVKTPDYFAQGDDAEKVITEIHAIWIKGEMTEEEAFDTWINNNL